VARDAKTLSWLALFALFGWLIQQWLASTFNLYSLALIAAGVIGMVGMRSLWVAPLGLLVGEFLAMLVLRPRVNPLEIGVMVAALSMTVLAGLIARGFMPARAADDDA
jgi:uncharacterized membrane protein YjjB (DUF3815 family)